MSGSSLTSANEAHHAIQIIYPALDQFDTFGLRSRDVLLLRPENAENRYEPLPLVQDRAITANANRDSDAECTFVSMTKASCEDGHPDFPSTELLASRTSKPTVTRLVRLLEYARQFPGKSVLKVLTSCNASKSAELVHISYEIRVRGTDRATCVVSHGQHTFKLSDLEANTSKEQWLLDLKGLIRRTTDHAVRHVRSQLDGRSGVTVRDVKIPWKGQRHPPYRFVIEQSTHFKIVSLRGLSEDELSCGICTSQYAYDRMAVELPCGHGHMMCLPCLVEWSQHKYVPDVSCHICRAPIYQGLELQSLQIGTSINDPKAYNRNDPGNRDYNRWETFRRLNADLDKVTADQGLKTFINVNPNFTRLVLKAWDLLVLGDFESHTSTPRHLQPARSPQTQHVRQILYDTLREYEGAQLTLRTLYSDLCEHVDLASWRRFVKGGMARYLRPAEIDSHGRGGQLSLLGVRPGFQEFVQKTMSRALMFTVVRLCGDECDASKTWHSHGERLYYKLGLREGDTASSFPQKLAEPTSRSAVEEG